MNGVNGFGNNLILVASDEKIKKDKKERVTRGGGIASCLTLMKQVLDFQDLVSECAEAQEVEANKEKIESINRQLDSIYSELMEMAKGGRNFDNVEQPVQENSLGANETELSNISQVNTPAPPKSPSIM